MQHPLIPIVVVFLGSLFVVSASAAEGEKKDDDMRALFNGKDLSGWVPVNTAPSTWTVKDEMLVCSGKPIGELRTDRMFQNFILELEWRHMVPKGNAGVFIWADDITARGQPFHRGIEVQVLENAYGNSRGHTTHGDIFPIHGAKMVPLNGRGGSRSFPTENRSKPSPEWNHYRITCKDGAISLAVNGKVVTEGKDCSPRKGYICLESEGGVVHYRNLRIKELPDTPVDPAHVAIANRGYKCLYNGVDLTGWVTPKGDGKEGSWKPRDWNLVYNAKSPAHGSVLETEQKFSDFGFIFDVRLNKNTPGLARVQLRGSKQTEIVLDPADALIGKHLGGGWNRFEGTLRGNLLSLTLNGNELFADRKLDGAPKSGPLRIVPAGSINFANIYTRKLE